MVAALVATNFFIPNQQIMLQKHGHFNDLSAKFRKEMEDKINALGKKVKFKFNISHENPDPAKYNGDTVWPNMYTLDPRTFRITDPYEDRPNVSKSKEIGLVDKVDNDGKPISFNRIRILEREKGMKSFDTTKPEEYDQVLYLLLHPKLKDGRFQNANKHFVFEMIDEHKEAKFRKERRDAKLKAGAIAREMDEKKIIEFASAMMWDTSEDPDILKDRVEELAETKPEFFNDFISGKNVEYQAVVRRALDNQIIGFDPAEFKYIWASNQQLITVLSPMGDKNHIEKLSDWLQTGGQKSDQIYKRIKELVNAK